MQVIGIWECLASELQQWLPAGAAASGLAPSSALAAAAAMLKAAGSQGTKSTADADAGGASWLLEDIQALGAAASPKKKAKKKGKRGAAASAPAESRVRCLSLVLSLARTFMDAVPVAEHNKDRLERAACQLGNNALPQALSAIS